MAEHQSNRGQNYTLHSELVQMCMPAAQRDRDQKVAWVNSLCLLYVIIGLVGLNPPVQAVREVPPIEEPLVAVIEPLQQQQTPQENQPDDEPVETNEETSDASQVVVVVPDAPSVRFSVPTVGNVMVRGGNVAALPPAQPLRPVQQVTTNQILNLSFTGRGGNFPQPDYPQWALKEDMKGTLVLLIKVDTTGAIVDVGIDKSTGFGKLDVHTISHIKRRFSFPANDAELTYRLQVDYNPL